LGGAGAGSKSLHHCSFNWVGVHPAHLPFVAVLLLVNILWDYAICNVLWLDKSFKLDWRMISFQFTVQ
jgi:hypothetical protein